MLLIVASNKGISAFHARSGTPAFEFEDDNEPVCCVLTQRGSGLAYGTSTDGGRRLVVRALELDGGEVSIGHNDAFPLADPSPRLTISKSDVSSAMLRSATQMPLGFLDQDVPERRERRPSWFARSPPGVDQPVDDDSSKGAVELLEQNAMYARQPPPFLSHRGTPTISLRASHLMKDQRPKYRRNMTPSTLKAFAELESAGGSSEAVFAFAAVAANGGSIAALTHDGHLMHVDLERETEFSFLLSENPPWADDGSDVTVGTDEVSPAGLAISHSGDYVAMAHEHHEQGSYIRLSVVSVRTDHLWTFYSNDGQLRWLSFSLDGQLLGFTTNSRKLKVFEQAVYSEPREEPGSPFFDKKVCDSTDRNFCFSFVPGEYSAVVTRRRLLVLVDLKPGGEDRVLGNLNTVDAGYYAGMCISENTICGMLIACIAHSGHLYLFSFEPRFRTAHPLASVEPANESMMNPKCITAHVTREEGGTQDSMLQERSCVWSVLFGSDASKTCAVVDITVTRRSHHVWDVVRAKTELGDSNRFTLPSLEAETKLVAVVPIRGSPLSAALCLPPRARHSSRPRCLDLNRMSSLVLVGTAGARLRNWSLMKVLPPPADFAFTAIVNADLAKQQLAQFPYLLWIEGGARLLLKRKVGVLFYVFFR